MDRKKDNRASFREILGDACLFGLGAAFFVAFMLILTTGGYLAVEDMKAILYAEIGMAVFMMGLGIERFIDDCRRK